jgi:N-acetylglucosamine-6-phosphate deacetylase
MQTMTFPDIFSIKNVNLIEGGSVNKNSAIVVDNGLIAFAGHQDFLLQKKYVSFDLDGWFVSAGFIDLQLNGAYGYDFTENPESIPYVAKRLPETGVVSFLPTFITSPLSKYPQKLAATLSAQKIEESHARVLGAHLEGPFLNPSFPGAHPISLLCEPTPDRLKMLSPIEAVRMVTLAVEQPGGIQAAKWLQDRGVVTSIGHSGATNEEAQQYFSTGVRFATHLYNAMPALHHRQPGLIGALLTTQGIRVSLIADAIHCHPVMLKLTYRCKGDTEITLVTDAISAMGMPPGQYSIGGQEVFVDNTSARLKDGRLAGSILRMDQAVRNMVTYTSCSIAEAIHMANAVPADVLGMGDRLGHVIKGYSADIVLLDETLHVQATLLKGQIAFATPEAMGRLNPNGVY